MGILAVSQGGVGGEGGEGAGTTGGGSGGFGGTGGTVNIAGNWDITTTGNISHAIWGKSVGGAAGVGGSGGWLFGDPGRGGTGLDGGKVEVISDGHCYERESFIWNLRTKRGRIRRKRRNNLRGHSGLLAVTAEAREAAGK